MTDVPGSSHSGPEMHTADQAAGERTLHVVLALIAGLAKRMLPNADGAGVTVSRDGQWRTAASTDEFVTAIDALQYASGEGPCLSAIKERAVFFAEDLGSDPRWPRFAQAASREGVSTVLSVPLASADAPIGALNIYGRDSGSFSEQEQHTAGLLAREAGLALAETDAYSSTVSATQNLRAALESREVIGQAKGIIMERERCSSDQAFATLRDRSQRSNRKLRDVAQEIVDSVEDPRS